MKRKGEVRKELQIRKFYKLKQCWFKILLLSQKEKKIRSLVMHGHRTWMSHGAGLAANHRKKKNQRNCYDWWK